MKKLFDKIFEFHRAIHLGLVHDVMEVEHPDGQKEWLKHRLHHREDGPAIIRSDGTREYYKFGVLHRTDGPAFERLNGDRYWYLNGKEYTLDAFLKEVRGF